MATPGPESEAASEASSMAPPQASTSAAAAPASDPSAPPPAAGPQKPKRKRSTKEKVPGPGKNWRKGLKGALSKKSLEHDADGHLASSAVGPDASSDALGSPSPMVVAAASSPGGPSASAPKPKAKKQKTQPHGQSPAPESVVSKELQANKGPTLFAKTPRTRHWRQTQKTFTNIAGQPCSLPVFIGDEESPFALSLAKGGAAKPIQSSASPVVA